MSLKWMIAASLMICMAPLFADEAPTKTYRLMNLQRVTSNHPNCHTIYQSLQKLTTRSVNFSFASQGDALDVNDKQSVLKNHTYRIVSQTADNQMVNRVGLGSFDLADNHIEYVITTSADLNKAGYKYLYPMILFSENAHCYYMALLKPNKKTIEDFKKHIQSGSVNNKTDLIDQ